LLTGADDPSSARFRRCPRCGPSCRSRNLMARHRSPS
jgi:ribosomal protein S27AE